ncbi:uncharacterized protein [Acropora muricata]|uniref:uncharacterized protein n=1 Tax=Acropora muricata TaxID=159855 RepID=UPI0034E563F7
MTLATHLMSGYIANNNNIPVARRRVNANLEPRLQNVGPHFPVIGPSRNLEEFNVHIIERGTKYVEKIAIDEKNDLEFSQVPAHNGLTEADYLYDFKSVSVSNSLPNNTVIARKYWSVSEEVDKTFFSQAVQDFCDQFPIFRLQEAALNMSGRTCFARRIPENIGFCDRNPFPTTPCGPYT